ncbi:MAG: GntR family transcriptional regulator [Firmicutes bacterium]|nr:GntR family transcriptional regulator [Bacillota bacterium]
MQIKAYIEREIASGRFEPGKRIPSEAELARQFGVSRITTRQALAELAAEGLLYRAQGKGTFVRAMRKFESAGAAGASEAGHDDGSNSTSDSGKEAAHRPAGAGARRRRPNIAFVGPIVASPLHTEYGGDIASGLEQAARSRGFTAFTVNSANDPQIELDVLDKLVKDDVGGIALWPVDGSKAHAFVRNLIEARYPIVLVDRYLTGSNACAVASDNFGGAFAATRYLISLGHRRIGFITTHNLSTTSVAERLRGYRHALKVADIPYEPTLVFDSYPWYVQVAELSSLLDGRADSDIGGCISYLKEIRPTAVITLNERVAVTFLRLCRELGLKIPGDIAMITFDGRGLDAYLPLRLSLVYQPGPEIGVTAAHMLFDMIDGKPVEDRFITLPTELIIRESSGGVLEPAMST